MSHVILLRVRRRQSAPIPPPGLLQGLLIILWGLGLCQPASVSAQSTFAQIQGTVTAHETGKGLESVTVVVNGPALQEYQSEVTDKAGQYLISQLPPGDDYQVSFYFGSDDKPRLVRSGSPA